MRSPCLGFLPGLLLVAAPVAAQSRSLTPQPVQAASCDSGLRLLGLGMPPRSGDLRAAFDSVKDSTIISFMPLTFGERVHFHPGINWVSGIMNVGGHPPTALAYLELDFMVESPAPLPSKERQLTFHIRDSVDLHVAAYVFPGVSTAPGAPVDEHIVAMLPPDQAVLVLGAGQVQGTLGSVPFQLSDRERAGLHALVMYARCGPK